MTTTETGQATPSTPARTQTSGRRLATIAAALAGLLIVNLAIYAAGRGLGGAFTYPQNGATLTVDPLSITIMSLGPLVSALVLTAALARMWPAVIRIAQIAGPILAVATIALMTVPAGFDTTSTVALGLMHLTTIPAILIALNATPRPTKGAGQV